MEKIAGDMSGLLQETLKKYQDLKSLLEIEKKYITDMDLKKLWLSTEKKKALVSSIESIITKILGQVKHYISHLEMNIKSFRVWDLVAALPLRIKAKSKLKAIGLKIDTCKREIAVLVHDNKRYISEYLSVINGIFNTVGRPTGQDQYTRNGYMIPPRDNTSLINAEV